MLQRTRVGVSTAVLLTTGLQIGLGVALLALSVTSIGAPASLILLGGWLLSAACSRFVPGLDGAVSWAAGVVLELSLVGLFSGVLATVSNREHGRGPTLVVLGLPALLGAAGLAFGAWRSRTAPPPPPLRKARPSIAAVLVGAGLALPMIIASHGANFRVAWVMGGDGRNHVLIARAIIHEGGLTIGRLRLYPALVDALTALISGGGHRAGLPPGQLMLHDARALVAAYVVTGIALAALTAAALLELLPKAVALAHRLPAGVVVIALLAASTSVSALVLGTTLQDGYYSSYATLPLVIASMILAMRGCDSTSPAAYLLLGPAAIVVFLSWTLLAVIPMALILLVPVAQALRGRAEGDPILTRPWLIATAVALFCDLALAVVVLTHVKALHIQFLQTGSIIPPRPRLLLVLGLFSAGLLAAATRRERRWQLCVPVVSAVVGGVTVRFLIWLGPDGKAETYYSWKMIYLTSAALLWVVFVPALLAVTPSDLSPGYGWRSGGRRALAAGAVALTVLIALPWTTTVLSPLQTAKKGWTQPNAATVTETVRIADRGQPFVLWHWSGDDGSDRLGNFWSAAVWAYTPKIIHKDYPDLPGGVTQWAYFESGTQSNLCHLVKAVNGINIITRDPKVKSDLFTYCPNLGGHVFLEK